MRELRAIAVRTLTQGHLAQHLFFHSLHQFAIPSEAPTIFGVSDAQFRVLRRGEQSPLEIGRLHGRSPGQIERLSAAVLRERIRAGISSGAMPRRQGRLLLRRQLSQLPRWLAQVRYNGPPTTHRGALVSKPRDYAANPALSADGARVVFEAYQQTLPLALSDGEISVASRALAGTTVLNASQPDGVRRTPRSAYNPSASRDGRYVAFESAEGNLNFAKRYGQINVFVRDTVAGRTRRIGHRASGGGGVSRSEYNPALAADGRHLAYQAARTGGASAVWVCDLRTGRSQLASRAGRTGAGANAAVFEPAISGDGRKVAFTSAASNLGAGRLAGRTQVFVRDVARRTTTLVSRANGRRGAVAAGYSSEPSISQDGRFVAFSSAARNLGSTPAGTGASRIYVRDLARRRTIALTDASDGFVLHPSISGDGRRVAYTAIDRDRSRVLVRDVLPRRSAARLVSRATGAGGAAADGPSTDPSISADGRRVAFSSLATNLAAGKPDDRRGVFVRDLRRATTTLVSGAVAPGAPAGAGAKTAAARPAAGAPGHGQARGHGAGIDRRQRLSSRRRPARRAAEPRRARHMALGLPAVTPGQHALRAARARVADADRRQLQRPPDRARPLRVGLLDPRAGHAHDRRRALNARAARARVTAGRSSRRRCAPGRPARAARSCPRRCRRPSRGGAWRGSRRSRSATRWSRPRRRGRAGTP